MSEDEDDGLDENAARKLGQTTFALYVLRDELTQQAVPLVRTADQFLRTRTRFVATDRGRAAAKKFLDQIAPEYSTPTMTDKINAAIDAYWAAIPDTGGGTAALPLIPAAREGVVTPETVKDHHLQLAGWILAVVIMWILVLTAPPAIQDSHLSAEAQQTLNDYYGVVAAIALALTGYIITRKIVTERRK